MESVSSAVLKYQHLSPAIVNGNHTIRKGCSASYTRMPDHVITAEAMMWKWPEMNFYAGELRVKMRYSVFHTQLHHDSRQVYRNLHVSCTIVEML